jgi:hypothetical protein
VLYILYDWVNTSVCIIQKYAAPEENIYYIVDLLSLMILEMITLVNLHTRN